MSAVIDLQLQQQQAGGPLTVFVVTPSARENAVVEPPAEALEWQAEWRRQFLAFHDPAAAAVSADAVRDFSAGLCRALATWLEQSGCSRLREVLQEHPELPVRLRIDGEGSAVLERLPWEQLLPERLLWRLQPLRSGVSGAQTLPRARRPRLLLVVGDESGLRLDAEVERLENLQSSRRVVLRVLRGGGCTLSALRGALLDPAGWDALVFLGHSEADPNGGGRLHLGDGSWVGSGAVANELAKAAEKGLRLVLFNSCSGLDLARSSVEMGVEWALCFSEPVPSPAASLAFCALLSALEAGQELKSAVRSARAALAAESTAVGAELLLSLVGGPQAGAFRLPLRKRKQFLLRLSRSTRAQAVAAGLLLALGGVADVDPANPLSTYLLNRRLYVQRLWRRLTEQPGPVGAALPVVVLDQRSAEVMGAEETPGRVSRDLLAKVLQALPADQVPRVGLDVVLDEPAPFTVELADVIRVQQQRLVFAGYFGERVDARRAGVSSMPLPVLQQARLQARNLATGTPSLPGELKTVPLQLWAPLDGRNFAGALSSAASAWMPADAVIDWSIDWRPLLRRVELTELGSVQAEALVVGTDGSLDRDGDDLFAAPGAMDPALTRIWQGAERKMPGVLVQAVLAQSISLGHWLRPASSAMSTALAAGLGVLLAAAAAERRRRLLWTVAIMGLSLPLCLQVAAGPLWLVPVALPLTALVATALVRRD
jgi:CHASE2 domain-containing sensor protein